MKNENMIRISKSTQNFIDMLSRFREWMEKERNEMTDLAFMKKYSIWHKVLMKYMWNVDKSYVPRASKVILDPDVVNKMRLTMADIAIRDHFHTSIENLVNQCWRRSEHWIPQVLERKWPRTRKSINEMVEKKKNRSVKRYETDVELKTDRWETPEPTSYELEWQKQAIYVWTNPIKTLYSLIK